MLLAYRLTQIDKSWPTKIYLICPIIFFSPEKSKHPSWEKKYGKKKLKLGGGTHFLYIYRTINQGQLFSRFFPTAFLLSLYFYWAKAADGGNTQNKWQKIHWKLSLSIGRRVLRCHHHTSTLVIVLLVWNLVTSHKILCD